MSLESRLDCRSGLARSPRSCSFSPSTSRSTSLVRSAFASVFFSLLKDEQDLIARMNYLMLERGSGDSRLVRFFIVTEHELFRVVDLSLSTSPPVLLVQIVQASQLVVLDDGCRRGVRVFFFGRSTWRWWPTRSGTSVSVRRTKKAMNFKELLRSYKKLLSNLGSG